MKMMKRLTTMPSGLGVGMLVSVLLLLAGCSKEEAASDRLPDGEYPMSFTASVEGQPATRATTDNTWAGDELIGVSVDNGATYKTYKITETNGAMAPNEASDVYYWQFSKNQPIRAWYPVANVTNVDISNQSSSYTTFDYLTSDGSYNFAPSVSLPFKHQMAKVKYTLVKGDGVSDIELSSATVVIYGYTKANFAKGALTGNANGWITPYATNKEAIVVPQQMQNQKFIKVTIGADAAQREYYYTPTNATDANLTAGNQYTYTITVKKTELEVAVKNNGAVWTDNTTEEGNIEAAKFHIRGGDGMTLAAEGGGTLLDQSGYKELSGTNLLKVTVAKQNDKFQKGISVVGMYTIQSWKSTVVNYEIIYQLKGDITLTSQGYATKPTLAVGSYYYADGEWSMELWSKPCIGIVFKVGKDDSDDSNYPNNMTVHGYVVALEDANSGTLAWANKEGEYKVSVGASADNNDWNGYSNYQKIKAYNIGGWSIAYFHAANACLNFETTFPKYVAPNSSSGWFLPSAGQLKYLYDNREDLSGKIDKLKSISGYEDTKWFSGDEYWSSSEYRGLPRDAAWSITFDNGNLNNNDMLYDYNVRGVFAF